MTVIPQDAPRSDDGQWWWDGTQWQPTTAVATPDVAPPVEEDHELPRLRRSDQGWLLTLKATDASAVERTIWPNGTPPGVSVVAHSVNEQDQIGTFLIVGLTGATSQTMEPSWANWMAQVQMFPEEPASTEQQPQPLQQPSVAADGGMTPEEAESAWTTFFNEGEHTVLEFASWFAKEGGEFATVYEGFAGPMGYAMMLYDLFSNTIEAFQEEMKAQRQKGFLFGLVWQVTGMSDVAPTMMDELAPTADMFNFEEHADAFNDGVKEGRSRGESDVVLHNSLAARIAYRMTREHAPETWAAQETLTELAASAGVTDYRQLVIGSPQVQ